MSFLVLDNFRWNHDFYSAPWFQLFLSNEILAKTDSVHENARFLSLPDTNSVRQFLPKIHFFDFSLFWMTTLKNTIFYWFCSLFRFLFFSFVCFYFSSIKKTKMQFSFRKPHFWHPQNLHKKKTLFWHNVTLVVLSKMPQKTIKMGKAMKQTWTNF